MILVLADDFSGAAEVAGIALSYGLSVEISTGRILKTEADLLVIDSNARAKTEAEAVRIVSAICKQIRKQAPAWIFIKIDSVLRGHIKNELQTVARIFGRTSILIVPANPSQGRVLVSGNYMVGGIPLNQTNFKRDPDFPRRSGKISELLPDVQYIKKSGHAHGYHEMPQDLYVAEAADLAEVRFWAAHLPVNVLPAGAADFFRAILESKKYRRQPDLRFPAYKAGKVRLVILGSQASVRNPWWQRADKKKYSYCPLSLTLSGDQKDTQTRIDLWIDQIVVSLQQGKTVVTLIEMPAKSKSVKPPASIRIFSEMAVAVNAKILIEELIIEGGSTASQVLRNLRWTGIRPVLELANGVVVMKIMQGAEAQLVVKPGSYQWPVQMWQEN